MRIAIPRRVKLRGRWWSVRLTSRKRKRAEMRGLRGLCDLEARVIWIDANADRLEREVTYVHEVLHALFPPGVVAGDVEERIVSELEGPLAAAIAEGAFMISPPDEVP